MVRTLLLNENFIRTTNTSNGVSRKFSWGKGFIQWHLVVISISCPLFVTSQVDVIFMFPNQHFGEFWWRNMHILLHALSLFHVSLHLILTRGQTATLRTFPCGSLSFPKIYIFVFYFLLVLQSVEILENSTVVASWRAVQCYFCKSFQKSFWCHRNEIANKFEF